MCLWLVVVYNKADSITQDETDETDRLLSSPLNVSVVALVQRLYTTPALHIHTLHLIQHRTHSTHTTNLDNATALLVTPDTTRHQQARSPHSPTQSHPTIYSPKHSRLNKKTYSLQQPPPVTVITRACNTWLATSL